MSHRAASEREPLQPLYSKVSRRIVPMLLLAYVVAYLDRVNIGFAKLQMLKDLQLSEAVYGLGAGMFFVGYFLLEIPSNMILHRVGARRWIARVMISWGAISVAMMLVRTPATFYVLRFLLGAAEAGFFPGVIFYLTQWYPAARRGQIIALFMTGVPLSSAIGGVLSGWVMQTFDGAHGWAGWQWLFLLEGIPAVLLGFYILLRLTDSISSARWLDEKEKSLLISAFAADSTEQSAHSFGQAFRDRRTWLCCVIYFCLVVGLYGIGFWLPTIIAGMGVHRPLHIGLLTALPYTAAAIGMLLVGRSADRRGKRSLHVAIPAVVGASGMVMSVLFAQYPAVAIAALTLATFGTLTAPPLFWGLPTAYLRDAGAAAGIAIINSFGNLGGFASPYVIGWIKDVTGSTDAGMYFAATTVMIGAALVLFRIPSRHEGLARPESIR